MDIRLFFAICVFLESFPISSSGHSFLLLHLLRSIGHNLPVSSLITTFDYLAHGMTLCILAFFFSARIRIVFRALIRKPILILRMLKLGIITESMTVLCYPLFMLSRNFYASFFLSLGFFVTTLSLYSLRFYRSPFKRVSWNAKNAVVLGLLQGMALLPGISRFALTFIGGKWLGFTTQKAFEISFLIEAPISLAAFFKALCDICFYNYAYLLNLQFVLIMIMSGCSAYYALVAVWFLIKQQKLWVISYYTALIMIVSFFV